MSGHHPWSAIRHKGTPEEEAETAAEMREILHENERGVERTRLKTEIIGPYTGGHISGASTDVIEASFTVSYTFDDVTIIVEDIPGRWDRVNNRELVAGKTASQVYMLVTEARTANACLTQEQRLDLMSVRIRSI